MCSIYLHITLNKHVRVIQYYNFYLRKNKNKSEKSKSNFSNSKQLNTQKAITVPINAMNSSLIVKGESYLLKMPMSRYINNCHFS